MLKGVRKSMQEVFNFILSHYEAILSVLTLIISIVILIIRKKPVLSLNQRIYDLSITAVKEAEKKYGGLRGSKKLDFAIDYVVQCLTALYPDLDITRYVAYIEYVIESILSTPHKKED